jgi:hypothetical protein
MKIEIKSLLLRLFYFVYGILLLGLGTLLIVYSVLYGENYISKIFSCSIFLLICFIGMNFILLGIDKKTKYLEQLKTSLDINFKIFLLTAFAFGFYYLVINFFIKNFDTTLALVKFLINLTFIIFVIVVISYRKKIKWFKTLLDYPKEMSPLASFIGFWMAFLLFITIFLLLAYSYRAIDIDFLLKFLSK